LLFDFLEEQDEGDAEQGEDGQQVEVIRVGQQGGLLLNAAPSNTHNAITAAVSFLDILGPFFF